MYINYKVIINKEAYDMNYYSVLGINKEKFTKEYLDEVYKHYLNEIEEGLKRYSNNEEKIRITKEELLQLYYYPICELIRENLNGTSSCEFNLEFEDGIIKCNVKMNNELFSYFRQCSDMISQKNYECDSRLSNIVENLSDKGKDIIITVEWIA